MSPVPTAARLRWFLGGAALLFLLQSAAGLRVESGTVDELAAHLPAGILHWKSGEFSGGLANPPLGQRLVTALPVAFGRGDRPLEDSPGHLLPARLPVLALGLVTLLALAGLAHRIDGPAAAALAATAAAFSPELLAHSRLATLDLPSAAFFLLAGGAAWRWSRAPSLAGLAAVAIAAGVAASIKFSALHLLPGLALGAVLLPGTLPVRLRRSATLTAAATLGVVAFAWLTYGPGPARWLLPAAWWEGALGKLGPTGHVAYLLGERRGGGFAHWFLVAFAVKTPLPILVGAAAGAVHLIRRRASGDAAGFVAFVLVPALWLVAALSLVHRVNIGLRHALPAVPALLILAGVGAGAAWRSGRLARGAAIAGVVLLAVSVLRASPHHLSYFHELVGGPAAGDRILIDSNLDWGQDEAELRKRIAGRGVVVNPRRPVAAGLVAVSVNARHGLLERDGLRRRWIHRLPVVERVAYTWTIHRVEEPALREAADRDPVAALDYAHWLEGTDRPAEALEWLRRNDLSAHDVHGATWHRVTAEALLDLDRPEEAMEPARRADDADLALAVAARVRPWDSLPPREALGLVTALARRGEDDLARRLGVVRLGTDPFAPRPIPAGAPVWTEAARLKELGREREALAEAGRVLARHPADEGTLWLYGELVVRRKTGMTEYAWPDVDWGEVGR